MLKRINVNPANIRQNLSDGGDRSPCIVRYGNKKELCWEVTIDGPSRLVYDPDKLQEPHVWIETESLVVMWDKFGQIIEEIE